MALENVLFFTAETSSKNPDVPKQDLAETCHMPMDTVNSDVSSLPWFQGALCLPLTGFWTWRTGEGACFCMIMAVCDLHALIVAHPSQKALCTRLGIGSGF